MKLFDLSVPLTQTSAASSSSTSWTRKQLAQLYQSRLHQLGYCEVAFCHTAYGRVDAKKDDADTVLPWKDLVSDVSSEGQISSFGRRNSLGMNIYRRINIVFEEVTDVSRLLLPTQSTSGDLTALSIDNLLQKYDIISLQPMNEPTFQNICELLPSNDNSSSTQPKRSVDIIVLEYATGSRGGYGLPYRLRKDSLVKAMEAGATFELCYGTAMIDPKRRQGFLKTLSEFHSTFNTIQKKHMLLNKHITERIDGKTCKSDQFPLLISSGSRQNYSAGTDEGMMTFRSPKDVQFLVGNFIGGNAWKDKSEYTEETKDERKRAVVLSAAEKVLARASDRNLGVVTLQSKDGNKKKRRIRAHVREIQTSKNDCKSDDETDKEGSAKSIIDWLSAPIDSIEDGNGEDVKTKTDSELADAPGELSEADNISLSEDIAQNVCVEDDDDDLEDGYLAL